MTRGDIWWASLPDPRGSEPGFRRPVLIIQSDAFNRSMINTVIVAVVSSNVRLAAAPGNVLLRKNETRLRKDSVVNVSQLVTVSKNFLVQKVARIPVSRIREVEGGLRLVLSL